MYFNAEAQARILSRFTFSLKPTGFLVLGRAEMLFSHSASFSAVELKRRVFRVVAKPNSRDRMATPVHAPRPAMVNAVPDDSRLQQAAFDAEPVARIVLDASAVLVAANSRARQQFGLSTRDVGRNIKDLEISYRPAELRGALEQAVADRREVIIRNVHWPHGGEVRYFDVTVAPLFDENRTLMGSRVSFEDVTRYRTLESELHASKQALDTAYEELQSTNEELETTNEELQSTVEELETTNEELQSTNEELETMNEELQSTNEELQTMNDEMRSRSSDLTSSNAFLESIFGSLRSAVVVLDREYRVRVWNEAAKELWGLRADEAVGAHFLGLDIGLPVAQMGQPIRDVVGGAEKHRQVTVAAVSRRGQPVQCDIRVMPLRAANASEISGAILVMEEVNPSPRTEAARHGAD
jgi:two-component system CheB/CheR fusion protein